MYVDSTSLSIPLAPFLPQWRKEYKSTAWIRKGLKGETTKEIDDLSEELAEIAEITKEILS